MNIEQIAQEVADELGWSLESSEKFIARCLSKLAEQAGVEPVGFMDGQGVLWETVYGNPLPSDVPLYTEPQLIATQQRTAEACAKVCRSLEQNGFNYETYDGWENIPAEACHCEIAIQNGEWREYL